MAIRCKGLEEVAKGPLVGVMLWQGGPLQAAPDDVSALGQPPYAGTADVSFFRDPGRGDLGELRHMLIEDRAVFISKVPDRWEVGVDPSALKNDGGQYLQLSINIVCSR